MLDNQNIPVTTEYIFTLPKVEPHSLAVQREGEKKDAIVRVEELLDAINIPPVEPHAHEPLQKELQSIISAWGWKIVNQKLVTYEIPENVAKRVLDL